MLGSATQSLIRFSQRLLGIGLRLGSVGGLVLLLGLGGILLRLRRLIQCLGGFIGALLQIRVFLRIGLLGQLLGGILRLLRLLGQCLLLLGRLLGRRGILGGISLLLGLVL